MPSATISSLADKDRTETAPRAWDTDDQDVASLADFLAGYLTKGSIAVGNPERTVFSARVSTSSLRTAIQVTTSLNFNFGIRYDYMQPMHDSKKDLSVFRPGLTPTGIAFQGQDISSIYEPDRTSFSPRIGFSFNPAYPRQQ